MRTVLIMASLLSLFGRLFVTEPAPTVPYKQADIHESLRSQVLSLKPSDIGESDPEKILAVIMETGYEEAAATLVAVCDGTGSLYFSNGGGIIGGGEHPQGAVAAKALVAEARKFQNKFVATKETPLPMPGDTRFYIVRGKGLLTAVAKEDDLGEQRSVLHPLFYKGQDLITVIRLIEEDRRKKENGGTEPNKP